MYILKIWDNVKKDIILEVRTNSLEKVFSYLQPYASHRYQILIKAEEEKKD